MRQLNDLATHRRCLPYTDIALRAGSITFLGSWKRRENELKFLWGTEGFEVKERPRPQFVGAHVVDPETNRDEIVYSPDQKDQIWRTGSTHLVFAVGTRSLLASTAAAKLTLCTWFW